MPAQIALDGESLTVDDVVRLARPARHGPRRVVLAPAARERMQRCRERLEQAIVAGARMYGVTTGFGQLQERLIDPADQLALQRNLVRSHAAGVGPYLSEEVARGLVAARANSLAKGYSGVRPELVELLLEALNRNLYPAIPARGSVVASGDLAPLAHLAEVLLGEGQAWLDGRLVPSAQALAAAGLQPLPQLAAKEGVALVNGTSLMAAELTLALADAEALADLADVAAAMALEALRGHPQAYNEATQRLRPHPGQVAAAAHLRNLLAGSALQPPTRPGVQDPYSLRCAPQVHGAARDALTYVRSVVSVELNSANDNPLLLEQDDRVVPVSQGNFHGQPLSLAADMLAIGVASLATISERRTSQLMAGHAGLPPFLAARPGLDSGLMLVQYSAASLVAENRVLAHPASVDSVPTSNNYEDHVSMGPLAAQKARRVVDNVRAVLAIELLAAAQALDYQRRSHPAVTPAPTVARAHAAIRQVVPFVASDHPPQPFIEAIVELIESGQLQEAAASD